MLLSITWWVILSIYRYVSGNVDGKNKQDGDEEDAASEEESEDGEEGSEEDMDEDAEDWKEFVPSNSVCIFTSKFCFFGCIYCLIELLWAQSITFLIYELVFRPKTV